MSYDPIVLHDARLNTEIYINVHFLSSAYIDKATGYVVVATASEKHYVTEDLQSVKKLMGIKQEKR